MVAFLNLPLLKQGIKPLITRRLWILYPFSMQTRTSDTSKTYTVEIKIVDLNEILDQVTGKYPAIIRLVQKTHVFNANLQKQLMSDFNQKSKVKSQEQSKFIAGKKALMTIIYGQYGKATMTKIALRRT